MRKILFTVPLLLLVMLFSRCNINEDLKNLQGAIDSLQIVIGTPEFNTSVHIQFVDAKTKDPISGKTISATVSGANADDVYSNLGTKESVFTTGMGLLDLVIDPKAVDTTAMKTTPLEFDLQISADGYASTTQRVMLYEAKRVMYVVLLTNLSNAPEGVTIAQNPSFAAANSSGQTTSKATQELNSGKQTVEIPAGVVMKDASGNPVTGTVQSQIIYYDPVSEDAQNAFPGGTNVAATLPDGTTGQIEFVSAGMFTVNLTAGNQEVKTFENGGATLKTVVPRTLLNPNTGEPVKVGDEIEMWSKEDDTGEWVYEKTSRVKEVNGELVLEEVITHLSSWNWDFYYNSCYIGPRFIWRGDLSTRFNYVNVRTKLGNSNFFRNRRVGFDTKGTYNSFLQLYRTPSNTPAVFTFEDANYDPDRQLTFTPSTISTNNMCANNIYIIDITETKTPYEQLVVRMNLSASSASNSQFVVRPNAYLYYRASNQRYWSDFYLRNGYAMLTLRLGTNYTLAGSFANSYGQGTLKVDNLSTNMLRVTMNPTISFGSQSQSTTITLDVPKPANDTLNVVYNAVLPDRLMNMLR